MRQNIFAVSVYKIRRAHVVFFLVALVACVPVPRPAQLPLPILLNRANSLIAAKQYSEAVKTLEQAARLYSDTPIPLIRIGQVYLKQHRWLLAEDAFNRALARDLNDPIATAGLAETALNQGNSTRALRLWQEAIELNPKLPGVFTGLGRTHAARFEFDAARDAFLKQQAHRPDPEAQWFLAALTAPHNVQAANDYLLNIPPQAAPDVLARRDYLLATLVPFHAESSRSEVAQATGIALVQVELWPLAVNALAIAYEESSGQPTDQQAELLAFLGHALAQAGRPALDLFQQSLEMNPDSALPLYFYGIFLRQQGALNAAEATLKQASELDPDNAAIYVELAQTKAEQGDFSEAESQYTTAAALAENDLQIQLSRVRFHANRGYNVVERGIPAAEEVIDTDENNAEAHDLLGWMQLLSGEPSKAEATLRRAIELDPELVSARFHLARHLEASGQLAAAVEQYQHVIDRDTSGLHRDQALKALQRLAVISE